MQTNILFRQVRIRLKLFEVLVCCGLFATFSGFLGGIMIPCAKTYFKSLCMEEQLSRDEFIAKGFIKICREKSDDELKFALIDWKKMCISIWPLDFLLITKSENFYCEKWSFNGNETSIKIPVDESI